MTIADHLLPTCAVRIDVRGTPSGTGFFVGRGVIVTCAHVVESSDPTKPVPAKDICAVVTAKEYEGVRQDECVIPVGIRRFAPGGEGDLAILDVRNPFANTTVLLDSRGVLAKDELHTFAYPDRKPRGVPRRLSADGFTGEGMVAFSRGQIQPGMSGAPLFNGRTGAVCGVISITRDKSQDLGGYAIPVSWLLKVDPKIQLENGQAHDGGSDWIRALSIEQRGAWKSRQALTSAATARSFTVSLGQTEEGWRVTVENTDQDAAPAQGLEEWVDLNAVREEVARLFRDWASQGRVQESEQLRLLGRILYSAAFPRDIGRRLRELSRRERVPVVVNLRFEQGLNKRVVELPWEHLCIPEDAERALYLATDERFGLARIIPTADGVDPEPELSEDLTVALVAVHHGDCGEAPEEDVVKRIARLTEESFPAFQTKTLDNPDADELGDLLRSVKPDVLHYVGCGRFKGKDEIALGPSGALQYGRVELLIDSLPDPPPRLVVLQMLGTPPGEVVPADFCVFAEALLNERVEAVLAYQYPVGKTATNKFNRELYTNLLAGHSVELATQEARRSIINYSNRSFVSPALVLAGSGPLVLCLEVPSSPESSANRRSSSFAGANV